MGKLIPAPERSPATVSPLQRYLKEISRYDLLEPEEELKLATEHYEAGDVDAAHRLITANLRLVVKIANDFSRTQAHMMDLIQEGNYGLMQAVKKFNPYKGVKLSSYAAWWIKAYILKYLMDNRGQVRIATTANQRKVFYNLQKETQKLLEEYDTADTRLLAARMDVPEEDVIEMQMRLGGGEVSLDEQVSFGDQGSSVSRGERMADENLPSLEDWVAQKELQELFFVHIEEFRKTLSERDADIFANRLLSDEPQTLQEIGNRYSVSRERARQLEVRIMKNFRQFVEDKGVLDPQEGL
ncbi:MAG: RNA polymerase sigma factor RpoD/SigA [Oligoflexales bacterium]